MANSLGTLNADIVTLRVFDFLRHHFGAFFRSISTDFSGERADFNQDVISRIPLVPTVKEYTAVDGYETSAASTTNIPVSLDKFKHVHVEFNDIERSSGQRNLVDEQAGPIAYALGKDMVDALMALVTAANFPAETVSTVANMERAVLGEIRKELNKAKVPPMNRFGLFNSDAYAELTDDARIVNVDNFARHEEVNRPIGHLTNIQGFDAVHEYADLPENDTNLIGFAGTRDSLVVSSRIPKDPAEMFGLDVPGTITPITDPMTGMTMIQRAWYDMQKGKLFYGLAWMFGVNVGVANNLRRVVHTATT